MPTRKASYSGITAEDSRVIGLRDLVSDFPEYTVFISLLSLALKFTFRQDSVKPAFPNDMHRR